MPSRKGRTFWSQFEERFAGRRIVASVEVELLAAEVGITMQGARDALRRQDWKSKRVHRVAGHFWCHRKHWAWGFVDAYFAERKLMVEARATVRGQRQRARAAAEARARAEWRRMMQELQARMAEPGCSPEDKAKMLEKWGLLGMLLSS